VAADVGASTGGFTDCLLQRGARRVYAIDVGYGQLDYRLRSDSRVVVMDRVNARYLTELPEPLDLAVMDVSFISVRLILPALRPLLAPDAEVVTLIKPQFEAGRERVGKKGVIQDVTVHRDVLREIGDWAATEGWTVRGVAASPIRGAEGNREFFYHLAFSGDPIDRGPAIEAALRDPDPRVSD
jgi:23S rRNA (cytidine1920-2'-O)/16S rRNA (cytidine1409-2'-O)-methyltransferase